MQDLPDPDAYFGNERGEMLPFLPKGFVRLLDVGCGYGNFGALVLKEHPGTEVWGVELHEPAARIAETRLSKVVYSPFSDGIALPDDYFDVIVFNDSLEHLPDEEAALQLARRKLRTGGTLVCSVPNVRYIDNLRSLIVDADWEYREWGVLDRTHLRFFTKRSLLRTLERNGFQAYSVEGLGSHHWSGWKIRLLVGLLGRRIEDTRWMRFAVASTKIPLKV